MKVTIEFDDEADTVIEGIIAYGVLEPFLETGAQASKLVEATCRYKLDKNVHTLKNVCDALVDTFFAMLMLARVTSFDITDSNELKFKLFDAAEQVAERKRKWEDYLV